MDLPIVSKHPDEKIREMFSGTRQYMKDQNLRRKVIREFETLAEKGCSEAMVCLGMLYLNQDSHEKALSFFKSATELGDTNAMRNLGHVHSLGVFVEKNNEKAAEWYLRAAKAGNPKAQCDIGMMYYCGNGVPKDHFEAVKWLSMSAINGCSRGQTNLGMMILDGKGTERNPSMAAYFFTEAASPRAHYHLAKQFLEGDGVEKNEERALMLLEDSSNRGYLRSTLMLASLIENNDPVRSRELYRYAASRGSSDSYDEPKEHDAYSNR